MPRYSRLTVGFALCAVAGCSSADAEGGDGTDASDASGTTGPSSDAGPATGSSTDPQTGSTGTSATTVSDDSDGESDTGGDATGDDESTGGHGDVPSYEVIRNLDPLFRKHEDKSLDEIEALGFFHDDFTMPLTPVDNGTVGNQGQFRLGCQYSHFALDDPIVHPGEHGAAHLHMFWGNTVADAMTTFDPNSTAADTRDVRQRGGGTCQGFELNRSAYWVPAVLDRDPQEPKIVVPDSIVLYYKSHRPQDVNPLPPGVELLAGNLDPGGAVKHSFDVSSQLFWSCGGNGFAFNQQPNIPTNCPAGEPINASIVFPQCLAVDGNGDPVLRSDNHLDHTAYTPNEEPCPASHPYRVPQISYLIYFPNGSDGAGAGVENWRLSSDADVPGGSLHGDWLGGWVDEAIEKWIDGCFDPGGGFAGPRNCSLGQTGQNGSGRAFRRVSNLNDYPGENFLVDPWPDHSIGQHGH